MISFELKTKSKDNKKDIILEDADLQANKIGARIKQVRETKGMSRKVFYKDITPHIGNCIAIEHGKRKIGKRLAADVIKHHHVNPEWLMTGEGEMFDEESSTAKVIDPGVPFFNVNLSEISFESFSTLNEPPEYYVNYRPFNDCDAYLPIYGDSMYPRYASGEIIAVREIINFEVIQWGEAYLLIADERANGISTVKLLYEHPNEKKIILRSSNPNFKGDTVLSKEMIKRLFLVKGKVTRHHL